MPSLRPSTRLALVILALGLLVLCVTWFSEPRVALFACGLVLLPVGWDAWVVYRAPAPRATRPESVQAVLRHPFQVSLQLDASERVTHVELDWPRDLGGPLPVTRLWPAREQQLRHTSVPRRRGLHRLGPVWLWLGSPLGLWQRRHVLALPCSVSVWPDLRGPADDVLAHELRDDGLARAAQPPQAGSEFGGLRPFQTGDDPRQVDWKASARSGHPIVRQWYPDRQRSVVVAIDAGRLMRAEFDGENKFDAAMRALVRVGLAARARGDRVGAIVYADRVLRWIPPLEGPAQAEHLARACSDIEPRGVESEPSLALPQLLAWSRRALVIWITDVLDRDGAERLIHATTRVSVRHLTLVALLRDPSLDQAFAQTIEDEQTAYRRAAAELVTRERELALDNLRARRIPALDLSMRGLALGVVRRYVDTRSGGRW